MNENLPFHSIYIYIVWYSSFFSFLQKLFHNDDVLIDISILDIAVVIAFFFPLLSFIFYLFLEELLVYGLLFSSFYIYICNSE